jgi:hypothetical protein
MVYHVSCLMQNFMHTFCSERRSCFPRRFNIISYVLSYSYRGSVASPFNHFFMLPWRCPFNSAVYITYPCVKATCVVRMIIKILFTISIGVLDSSISFQKFIVPKSNLTKWYKWELKFTLWFGPRKHFGSWHCFWFVFLRRLEPLLCVDYFQLPFLS